MILSLGLTSSIIMDRSSMCLYFAARVPVMMTSSSDGILWTALKLFSQNPLQFVTMSFLRVDENRYCRKSLSNDQT